MDDVLREVDKYSKRVDNFNQPGTGVFVPEGYEKWMKENEIRKNVATGKND